MRNAQGKVRNLSHLHILNCNPNEVPVVVNFLADLRNTCPKKIKVQRKSTENVADCKNIKTKPQN